MASRVRNNRSQGRRVAAALQTIHVRVAAIIQHLRQARACPERSRGVEIQRVIGGNAICGLRQPIAQSVVGGSRAQDSTKSAMNLGV